MVVVRVYVVISCSSGSGELAYQDRNADIAVGVDYYTIEFRTKVMSISDFGSLKQLISLKSISSDHVYHWGGKYRL